MIRVYLEIEKNTNIKYEIDKTTNLKHQINGQKFIIIYLKKNL